MKIISRLVGLIPFPDNNRHLFQTVGPRCCAAIIPGGAAAPPYHCTGVIENWYQSVKLHQTGGDDVGLRPGPGVEEFQPVKPHRTGRRDKDRLRRIGAAKVHIGCPVLQNKVRAAKHQTILTNRNVG